MSNEKRDLVLAQGTYAYMQDNTKGVIKTYTGPTVVNQTAQENPVIYDKLQRSFRVVKNLEEALCVSPLVPEGFYITLMNPAKDNRHPEEGTAQATPELQFGRTINIPGPATFSLWPGQVTDVIEGHHLRSNQYLLVRIYNEDEAKKNWNKAVIKSADGTDILVSKAPSDLTVGRLIIIRGDEVSFYIPPTGVEVVPEENGEYTRNALTLERLEYAILVDENGKKRFEVGPKVVFPTPSERFIETKNEKQVIRKFRAIELNEIQGIHVKVIASYKDETGEYFVGDELFITGKDTSIYFPREEHSVIKYDGKTKHFATAIPVGEARYVMNRLNGEIRTVRGPAMLLPDPRTEVIVRRVLSDRECVNWYPKNNLVLEYNRRLRQILVNVPTTRSGAISEGDFERNYTNSGSKTRSVSGGSVVASAGNKNMVRTQQVHSNSLIAGAQPVWGDEAIYGSSIVNNAMESSKVSGDQSFALEEFSRSATYTEPRTITLDTKFQGVPSIDVWNGFAVLVASKTGKRRVEQGPCTILMDYDESLELLSLSTGKPKSTDNLLQTPFLQVRNNKVADIVEVETADHVKVDLYISMHVNFAGEDPSKWFQVNNYVKLLCDHVRSVLKGQVQKLTIEEFYAHSTDLIRDFILGKNENDSRPGMFFEQNSMEVSDVEVLKVNLKDEKIRILLDHVQHEVVRSNLEVSSMRKQLEVIKEKESILKEESVTKAETQTKRDQIAMELAKSSAEVSTVNAKVQLKQAEDNLKIQKVIEDGKSEVARSELTRTEERRKLEATFNERDVETKIKLLEAETKAVADRFAAIQGGFTEALLAVSNNDTMVQIAKAWDTSKMVAGESLAETLNRVFTGTPLKGIVDKMASSKPANGVRN